MPDTKTVVNEIDTYINSFTDKIDPIQKKLYNKVSAILKDLSLDDLGNIKQTSANMDIISSVRATLNSVVSNPAYQKNVSNIQSALDDVQTLQENYFEKINSGVTFPAVADSINDNAFSTAVTSLTEAGLKENVINAAADIVSTSITEGTSFADMNQAMKDFIVGDKETDGKLVSYSKQILSDTMHTASRNYNSIMTEKLGLKWYRYVGALVADSRPWCIEMERKEFIHESELGKCASGNIDGRQVSKQGLLPDTNKENVVSRCGGYNCQHHLIPIPEESVPIELRRKISNKLNLSDEDKAKLRPTRG